ncbi:helix-turn-helix domain-containing protein, partial [Burkholderia gladioli]
ADRFVLGVTEGVVEPAGGAEAREAAGAEQSLKERVEQFERAVIADTLTLTGGAVAATADRLHVGKATLYEKIKRYGLSTKGENER